MRLLSRILSTTRVLWPFYVGIIICSLATAAATLISPFLVRDATDTIVEALASRGEAGSASVVGAGLEPRFFGLSSVCCWRI